MLTRHLDDVEQHFGGVDRTSWVVWVDDDDGFGIRSDFGADIADRRIPAVFFFAHIVHRCAAGEAGRCRPQWIVRRWHEHFIPRIEQTLHHKADQFRHAVTDNDIVQSDAFDFFLLRIVLDRFTRRENAFGVGVAAGLTDIAR